MLGAEEGQEVVAALEELLDVARKGDVLGIVLVVERVNTFTVRCIGHATPGLVGMIGAVHTERAQSLFESLSDRDTLK